MVVVKRPAVDKSKYFGGCDVLDIYGTTDSGIETNFVDFIKVIRRGTSDVYRTLESKLKIPRVKCRKQMVQI